MANKKQSGQDTASLASKVLKSKTATKAAKSLAGSVLAQSRGKNGKKK